MLCLFDDCSMIGSCLFVKLGFERKKQATKYEPRWENAGLNWVHGLLGWCGLFGVFDFCIWIFCVAIQVVKLGCWKKVWIGFGIVGLVSTFASRFGREWGVRKRGKGYWEGGKFFKINLVRMKKVAIFATRKWGKEEGGSDEFLGEWEDGGKRLKK